MFVWAALWQSAHSAYPVVFPLSSGKIPLSWKLASSIEFVYTFKEVLNKLLVLSQQFGIDLRFFQQLCIFVTSLHGDPSDKREDKADTLVIIEPVAVAVVDKTVNVVSLVVIDVNLQTKILHKSDIELEVYKVNQSHQIRPMTSSKSSNGISKTVVEFKLR